MSGHKVELQNGTIAYACDDCAESEPCIPRESISDTGFCVFCGETV